MTTDGTTIDGDVRMTLRPRLRPVRAAAMALTAALAIACGGDDPTGASTVTGTYTLRTVNGAPLPYTVSQIGTTKTETVSDVITLYAGFTYSQTVQTRTTTNGQPTTESLTESGTFELLGTSITLRRPAGAPPRVGTGNGSSMTFVASGVTAVYSK